MHRWWRLAAHLSPPAQALGAFTAVEPSLDAWKPLKWSSTPIIFDTEDHPDRITAVGCLPMLVSPTIRNLKVTKMLVDGGAGLNLISSAVLQKLQIPDSELEETGTFQESTREGASRRGRSRCRSHLAAR